MPTGMIEAALTNQHGDTGAGRRRVFLPSCSPCTVEIQAPLIDPMATRGHPNPCGLGGAEKFSMCGSWGQSSVLFPDMEAYDKANVEKRSPYGGAEYGIALTPEADSVCRKIAALHGGVGAVICPSGLSAITTTIEAFDPLAILIPDNVYAPLVRYAKRRNICCFRYSAGASEAEVASILTQVQAELYKASDIMMYVEAPGSGTFEIPDIGGIVSLAKRNGIRTVMDNTWASHVRFKPIEHGIDVAIQATTKYEGGYGDTPSGVVIAGNIADYEQLADELRASGNGAVAPTTCARLLARIDSTQERLDRHYETALRLMAWFLEQRFVADVLCPALEGSPYHERFKQYFGKGNGLFSVVFSDDIAPEKVAAFTDALNLFWVAESWGGHVSLVLPVSSRRDLSPLSQGLIMRFHAGLEDKHDLLRDLDQAAQVTFYSQPKMSAKVEILAKLKI